MASPSFILIPISGKEKIEGLGIRCKSLDEAENVAFFLGLRKFKIVEEIELVSIVRDKTIGKK